MTYAATPFGHEAADALLYDRFGQSSLHSIEDNLTILEKFKQYGGYAVKFDDLFHSSYVYYLYKLCGNVDLARIVIIITNSIGYLIGLIYANKAFKKLFGYSSSILIYLFACVSIYFATNNAVGLKESLFSAVVSLAIYHLICYSKNSSKSNLLLFFVFTSITLLLRLIIPVFLILSLIIVIIEKSWFRNLLPIIVILGIAGSFLLAFFLFNMLGLSYDMETIMAVASQRAGGSALAIPVNILAGLIGPFPKYIVDGVARLEPIYTLLLLIKSLFSIYFILGVWHIIINRVYNLWFLLIYIFLNIAMVSFSGVGLLLRFHITYIIPYFFIMLYGYDHYHNRYRLLKQLYILGMFLFIIVYNIVTL